MGCTNSNLSSLGGDSPGSAVTTKNKSVQDDARSFRSKVGAIKMLTKNPKSRAALMKHLESLSKGELLVCYQDLEEIKSLSEEQAFTRTSALVWRYKTMYEAVKIHESKSRNVEVLLWDSLGKLRSVDTSNVPPMQLISLINIAQNDILSRLILPFEGFLNSRYYKEWQQSQIDDDRLRHQRNRPGGSQNSVNSGATGGRTSPSPGGGEKGSAIIEPSDIISSSGFMYGSPLRAGGAGSVVTAGGDGTAGAASPNSMNFAASLVAGGGGGGGGGGGANGAISLASMSIKNSTYSGSHPDVLIVDDSIVTLKLTGLTLEKDGHTVDKAANGQVALDLMKQRLYDVVLIDLNMPVMDGFETVHSFREYERSAVAENGGPGAKYFPSDVSDISDNSGALEQFSSTIRESTSIVPSGILSSLGLTGGHHNHSNDKKDSHNKHNSRSKINSSGPEAKPSAQLTQSALVQRGGTGAGGIRSSQQLTPAHYHQLIIGMSTNVDEETRRRAFEAGMDYFLPKPFTLQKFTETLRLAMEQKELTLRHASGMTPAALEGQMQKSRPQQRKHPQK